MLNTKISLQDAADLVIHNGDSNTFIFQGRPGIGKSAMLKPIASALEHHARYIDCALLDLGDLQMPKVSNEYVRFVPNEMFTSPDGRPLIIMLDEIGKANRTVQNALLTLLHEHRIGNTHLPEGSRVFGTTNMVTDGVGDNLQAHAKNRVTFSTVRGPTDEEWIAWGINNGVDPMVLAWVREYPHALDDYSELDAGDADSNPYIFNPRKQQDAFVSPRSLFNASEITKNRTRYRPDVLISALAGTVGESAARDMEAYIAFADDVPHRADIIKNPSTTPIPKNPISSVILALGAVTWVDRDTIDPWMTYFRRMGIETQHMFTANAMRTPKSTLLATNRQFLDWALETNYTVSN